MFKTVPIRLGVIAAGLLLAGCSEPGAGGGTGKLSAFQLVQNAPEGAAPGSCWGNRVTPAIIETVEREVLVQPAQVSSDGRIQQPAVYRRENRQEILQERQEVWTEVVCPALLTPDFIASVQRALVARGFFRGEASGEFDGRTRTAVRKFQAQNGFPEPTLTVMSARALGLIAVARTPDT